MSDSFVYQNCRGVHTKAGCGNVETRVYYQNVRGLRTKINDLYLSAIDTSYDIVLLSETWLDNCLYDSELFSSNSRLMRCDRYY